MRRHLAAVLVWAHGVSAAGWAAAGAWGWYHGWQHSIAFLFLASVWANVAAHLAAMSGERPDQEVLERLDEAGGE